MDENTEETKVFLKKFELLAKENPDRTFFKWDAKKDSRHLTQSACMQQSGMVFHPNIILLGVYIDTIANTHQKLMTSPVRLQWAGDMSLRDMENFIYVSSPMWNKSVLSRITRA